jgi:hypothetical protein
MKAVAVDVTDEMSVMRCSPGRESIDRSWLTRR